MRLERRVRNLEAMLMIHRLAARLVAISRQQKAEAEERRRQADEAAAAARAEWEARRAAEDAARPVPPPVEPRAVAPPPPPPEPKPPPWTYDPPPEMQIRPIRWGPSVPDDDGSEDNYGWTIHEYDPMAEAYDDYDD